MAWPTASDYFEAVQNPDASFRDDELRQAEAVRNDQGLPVLYAGNFASVFQMTLAGTGRSFAVKCFTRKSARRQERYRHISAHLAQAALPFTVPFVYLEQGVRVGAEWFPILKMDWIDGQTLNQFVGERLEQTPLLRTLSEMWVKLACRLEDARVTHADLQHGNILLIPGSNENRVALRLVDYDGMYLPVLHDTPSGELGHPTYQSPQRLTGRYYGPEIDRFSHLVIYTALRALTMKGRELWQAYDNGDNLLFTQGDFKDPSKSRLLRQLWTEGPDDLRNLAGRLALAAEQPVAKLPRLEEIAEPGTASLTASQFREAEALLNGDPGPPVLGRSVPVKKKASGLRKVPAEWPGVEDFRSAILLPSSAFVDPELRHALAVPGADGLPRSIAGVNSVVFPMRSAEGKQWAVKCFTAMVPKRQMRYWAIAAHLQGRDVPCLAPFDYIEQGILVRGDWYPILKMDWAEGQPLHHFVARYIDQPALLRVVRDSWERMAQKLREAEVAHGDLEPSNVLVVAGDEAWRTSIKLVDYDAMSAAPAEGVPTMETGHPAYQHPQRAADAPLSPRVDHFSHLVIYTALRALVIKGPSLWRAYDKGDNLLFCVTDFRFPWDSKLLHELWQEGPEELRFLAGRVVLALDQPLDAVPPLSDVLASGGVQPLTEEEINRVHRLLQNPDAEVSADLPAPANLSDVQSKTKPFWASIAARLQQVLKKK